MRSELPSFRGRRPSHEVPKRVASSPGICRALVGGRHCARHARAGGFMALRKALALHRSAPQSTKARAREFLELAFPEKSLGERKAIAAAMWENLGRTFTESFCMKTLTESNRIVFEPAEGFDEAARGDKPFIVCGLHLGNWRFCARRPAARCFPHRRLSAHIESSCRSSAAQHARATLQGGSDAQDPHGCAPSSAPSRTALPVLPCRSQRRQRTVCALLWTAPRGQTSFPRSSPARLACRFMPAPHSGVRVGVLASASRPF